MSVENNKKYIKDEYQEEELLFPLSVLELLANAVSSSQLMPDCDCACG